MRNDRTAWVEPGAHPVAPGVHRVPLPLPRDGLRAINVYVVQDGGRLVLVDCGWRHPDTTQALRAGLDALGADPRDIKLVLCTHAHYDHYGLTAYIRDHSGATIALGREELESLRPALDDGDWDAHREHRRRWMLRHGAAEILALIEAQDDDEDYESLRASGGRWESPDRLLEDGETLELADRRLRVHLTPGHTRGHLAFEDPDARLLFAGDHVLPHITPSLGFEAFGDGHALERFLPSLRAIRDLPADLVLPGHGPVFDDLAVRVDELLDHHDVRLGRCVDLVGERGPCPARVVAEGLPWTRRDTPFAELDPLNSLLAVSETVTHLELLARDGRVRRAEDGDDAVTYAPA